MSKHTPGPWHVMRWVDAESSGMCFEVKCPQGVLLAINPARILGPENEESAANARLIAAAPDMLAELKAAEKTLNTVATCSSHQCVDCREAAAARRDQVHKVIFKAKGTS